MIYIIPARKGSKGYPGKNRFLFWYTASQLINKKVIVTSDDNVILKMAKIAGFKTHRRPDILSTDTTNIKDVIINVIKDKKINDDICMLYLTYPERKLKEIDDIITYYEKQNANSLLCSQEPLTHPYLCIQNGKQLISHDLYRRQDYPVIKEISHFVCIFKSSIITELNNNMYNDKTIFYPIKRVKDIDYETNYIM